ncbi:hypothetical protein ACHAW6_006259 [Cyclotella cf. meneghiniana]
MVSMTMTEIQGQLFTNQTVDVKHFKSYPIKSHHRTELLRAYNDVYAYLCVQGYCLQLNKLDNESSHDVEAFITKKNASFQYTPPEIYQTNIAERAIRTWKTILLPCVPA